jgi:hypothetical protein
MKYLLLTSIIIILSCQDSKNIESDHHENKESHIRIPLRNDKDSLRLHEYNNIMDSIIKNCDCELLKNDSLKDIILTEKKNFVDCAPSLDTILIGFKNYNLYNFSFSGSRNKIIPFFTFLAKRNDTTFCFFVVNTKNNFDFVYFSPIDKYLKEEDNILLFSELYPVENHLNCLDIVKVEYEPVNVAKWERKNNSPFWPAKDGKIINLDTISICK